jgi:eukaryotic-like serine/threonine-protein kinase
MVDRAAAASREGAPDPLLGRVINEKFKILSFIAKGGMGKVYRAEQAPLGRVCALKVLNGNYTGEHDPEFHKRFFLEASMTSKLRHPNTVTVFDYGQTSDGIYYMAMEYLEGYTLHRAIRQVGHFPEERAAHVARQICRSLREAHSLGVVHRDLKPANVYLLEHGDEPDFVKVLDFGLVKDVANNDAEELTQAGLFMGSPKYMAPEQIQGGAIDARTDIYALGVIMYEMIAGKVPFDHAKSLDILMSHVKDDIPPIKTVNPSARVSPSFEEAIMRALAKDPNGRFRSMDEVLAALKRLGPTVAPEPSASLTADRPSQTGSGPTASRIVRGGGAALAVPAAPESASGLAGDASAPGEIPSEGLNAPAPQQRRSPYPLVAALLGLVAVGGSLAYAKLHATHALAPAAAEGSEVATTTAPTAAAPGPSASVARSEPVKEVDFFALAPGGSASSASGKPAVPTAGAVHESVREHEHEHEAVHEAPHPKAAGLAPPTKPTAPAASTAPAVKTAPDCNPSYYYDADGNKHFKPECFGH